MPARKSAPKPRKTAKPTAAPHGPPEGQDKPAKAARVKPSKKAPKKTKPAARVKRGGAAASRPPKRQPGSSTVEHAPDKGEAAGSTPAPATTLKGRVQRFVDEYLIDLNPTDAYIRAGYKATGHAAGVSARRLMRNASVSAEIARRQAFVAAKLHISQEEALQEAWNIVKADANELIEFRRQCCERCWGAPPATQAERARRPNPSCPECAGEGTGTVFVHDTRTVSPAARSLYAGVKVTKGGLEVKMHNKVDALEKVFKHLGLYKADRDPNEKGIAEALREFFDGLHGTRLPIARPEAAAPAPAAHPLVGAEK